MLGRTVGWFAGSPLSIGRTFSGLDFLVPMAAWYVGWLLGTTRPRRRRAIVAAIAIIVADVLYLAALANCDKLLAALPDMVTAPITETSHLGIWTIGNGLRTLLPWNLPLMAVLLNGIIVVAMCRKAKWLPVFELDEKEQRKRKEKEAKEEVPGSALAVDVLFRFGPASLAVAAALLLTMTTNPTDLHGKRIVAYQHGYLDWLKPEYDLQTLGSYGMLPTFVESLGGKFSTSHALSEHDLDNADVLLLIHPNEPWSKETLGRIWAYVERGGSLLVAADPEVRDGKNRSSFDDVLQPTGMTVRQDTAVPLANNWELSCQPLSHPATAGIENRQNPFGLAAGSSIRTCWPARPVLVGRWGWSDPGSDAAITGVAQYDSGERLGDLVLAAEQPYGGGRIFVLGGTSPLRNEMLANSYPFIGRLLAYLANHPSNPQALWRQLLGFFSILAMAVLIAMRPMPWQLIFTSIVLWLTLVCCTSASNGAGRVLPDGRMRGPKMPNNLAYIDAGHLNAFGNNLWSKNGLSIFLQTLMRQGYLPLFADDLTDDRLAQAGLLVTIGPMREYSDSERTAIKKFVAGGGCLIGMIGAQEARPSERWLADYDFAVPPSPVAPAENRREPEPLGAKLGRFGDDHLFRFYTAWPVECAAAKATKWIAWSDEHGEKPVIVSRPVDGGTVVVIGDTKFAINDNFQSEDDTAPDRILFWRWLLTRVVPGQEPWNPPSTSNNAKEGSEGK
jgi:hypothetical protein